MTDQDSDPSSSDLPGAGWYPHPTMAGTQQYWDGQKWTAHIAPLAVVTGHPLSASGASDVVAKGVAKGAFLVISVCVLIALVLGSVVVANNDNREACESVNDIMAERAAANGDGEYVPSSC